MKRLYALSLALWLLPLFGCPNQASPMDPPIGTPDGGVPPGRYVIEAANLAPAVQEATSDGHVLRGRLKASDGRTATNGTHELRGGFVPLTR